VGVLYVWASILNRDEYLRYKPSTKLTNIFKMNEHLSPLNVETDICDPMKDRQHHITLVVCNSNQLYIIIVVTSTAIANVNAGTRDE
jgi:hypothetical protein